MSKSVINKMILEFYQYILAIKDVFEIYNTQALFATQMFVEQNTIEARRGFMMVLVVYKQHVTSKASHIQISDMNVSARLR